MEFFDKKEHTIDNCGSYEFNFTIDNVEDDGEQFIVTVTVDDINGTVILPEDGTLHKLEEETEIVMTTVGRLRVKLKIVFMNTLVIMLKIKQGFHL